MPTLPIEKGRPGPALLAHVLVSKYCDHLPLHRQADIYARSGVEIDRSVMAGWVGHMAALLEPLAERIARHVRAGAALHADDTPVPVLDPGRGRTKTGRLWTAVRDESPYGSTAPPAAFYLYSPDRKAERAHALLKGCRGHLHADAYAGFAGLYEADPQTGAPAPEVEYLQNHSLLGSASLSVLVGLIGRLADKRVCEKTWIGLPGQARGFLRSSGTAIVG